MVAAYLGVGKSAKGGSGREFDAAMQKLRAEAPPGMLAERDVLEGLHGLTFNFAEMKARAHG